MLKAGIDEGFFESDVNPTLVTHTIISLFSLIVENTARSMKKPWKINSIFIDEMKNIFQIMLRGIAREGIDRSLLALEYSDPGVPKGDPISNANITAK
jgi:hypothetical protein